MLTEGEFRKLADDELKALAKKLDAVGELTADIAADALVIEFDDGEKFVLSQQPPTRQLWFAASFQAGHYDFHEASRVWKDDKTGEDLHARISRDVSKKLGRSFAL